jgi:hypothetical protein
MKIVKTKKRDFEFLADNKINASLLKKIQGDTYGGGTTGSNDDTPANK